MVSSSGLLAGFKGIITNSRSVMRRLRDPFFRGFLATQLARKLLAAIVPGSLRHNFTFTDYNMLEEKMGELVLTSGGLEACVAVTLSVFTISGEAPFVWRLHLCNVGPSQDTARGRWLLHALADIVK